ncbi:MAG: methyl-accepting chemotaxis protein [Pirellulaceae bacterium]|jgi:methyl-accepting chemotaxis protein|nr:methyl-accepting chemotaxis protein [Pirellulaceae bacterium]MDP7016316.1 methyl-accepting chemotaxis protein [Pirellulaceae bacterium]
MSLTVAKKLVIGFSALMVLMAGVAVVVCWKMSSVRTIQTAIETERVPATMAASEVLNGVNRSLASLRGYMILGKDEFRQERNESWKSIETAMSHLVDQSSGWEKQRDVQAATELNELLVEFRTSQQEIEDICQADKNLPATKLFTDEAAPRATRMLSAISEMIHEEATLEPTPERRRVFASLANSRGSLANCLGAIRAYLLTGDDSWQAEFQKHWAANSSNVEELRAGAHMLTTSQSERFAEYESVRGEFAPLPQRAFQIRRSDAWNVANSLLATEVAPRAERASVLVRSLVDSQKQQLQEDMTTLNAEIGSLKLLVIGATVVGILLGGFIAWLLVRSITMCIREITRRLQDIAEGDGDLTKRLDSDRQDEFGEMAHWFNTFVQKLRTIIIEMSRNANVLGVSSTELSEVATDLSTGASQATKQSTSVASAAEEMSVNMSTMAQSTEAVSENVKSVALSLDEMTTSINEVAQNTEKSATVASHAADLAHVSNEKVTALGEAADEIGKVIGVIQDIAEQTNLLALNATIEAARAGEAGKGFAVVATEVKQLAKQTATATDDIRKRIEGIQSSTGEAVESIREIGEVIKNANDVSRVIAAAVEEQNITTKQISESVAQTASNAESVATSVNESASASREITQNMAKVDEVLRRTATGAVRSKESGDNLNTLANDMQSLVGQFKTGGEDPLAV